MTEAHRLGSVARRVLATQRVLVVEDERDIADFLNAYLRAAGYELVHIDPDEPLAVLQALDDNDPDCVLLDVNLRGFNGSDAYRLIRTEPRYAFVPVIVVSARPDAQALVTAPLGIDAYVTKPFNVNTLADLVVERIARAARLRETAGGDEATGLLGHDYVEARLVDELTIAAPDSPAAFALVSLRTVDHAGVKVGDDGVGYAGRELVRRVTRLLPRDAALGLTNDAELAILLPGASATEAAKLLTFAINSLEVLRLPDGAQVRVAFAVGVAAYPEHAADAEGIYLAAAAALTTAVASDSTVVISR